MVYSTVEYYQNNYDTITSQEDIEKQLKEASRLIDILTYNRLHKEFPEHCSEWELEILNEVCCEIADFYYTNSKDLQTLLNKYSLNGVSMEWGNSNANIEVINGITLLRTTYAKLNQTRFTERNFSYGIPSSYFNPFL